MSVTVSHGSGGTITAIKALDDRASRNEVRVISLLERIVELLEEQSRRRGKRGKADPERT
jgi:hypothetical protein